MDGARRVLRSVDGPERALAAPRARFGAAASLRATLLSGLGLLGGRKNARAKNSARLVKNSARPAQASRESQRLRARGGAFVAFLRLPGLGSALALIFLGAAAYAGAEAGGEYQDYVKDYGRPRDMIARALGFGVDSVTLAGDVDIPQDRIMAAAGVDPKQSLAFLDVADMRQRLLAMPLIKNVSVRKLFPNRLIIEINERRPYGLWQRDGAVSIIAADGAPIEALTDPRYESLPFVVGEGANERVGEYVAVLNAAGESLRDKIRAGVLVSQRRWNLKMKNGVDVMLPEIGAPQAASTLAQLDRDAHVLDKDIVSLDLRVPGKLYVRLTEEAAAAREAAHAHKPGART